jgi:phenylalanyl-tRNA synthetase beta chain
MTGGETFENRAMTGREFDFFDAKGALELALGAAHAPALEYRAAEIKHLRSGQAAEILLGEHVVGTVGRLSDDLAQNFKFRQPVFLAEVDLQTILEAAEPTVLYRPLPVYPAVERDVSLLVKRTVKFEDVRECITDGGFELIRSVEFVDVFEGKGIADDERSLTIRLVYRSDERTLIESEVEAVHAAVLKELGEKFDSRRRF